MEEHYQFSVTEVENPTFSKSELVRIGVAFIDNIEAETVISAASELDFKIDRKSNLMDKGLALTKLGSLENPQWALHKSKFTCAHIDSIWRGKDFYNISLIEGEKISPMFNKVYLRKTHINEDVKSYIEIHLKSLQPFHVYSEIVQ